jgi:hypothetical protein
VLDRAARLFVLVAFLLAQATALAHSIWHISSSFDGVRSGDSAAQDSSANPLCTQHGALDDVLGAVHGASPCACLVRLAAERVLPALHASASLAALAPSSRGPPRFS